MFLFNCNMCLFCKIVEGKIPSNKVYEDSKVLAFLDIAPVNHGHTLVIPKDHYKNMEEVPEDLLIHVVKIVKKIGKSLKDNLGVVGYNVIMNNDPIAGQIIPHLHFQIIPRNKNDKLKQWLQGEYKNDEAESIVNKIKITNSN